MFSDEIFGTIKLNAKKYQNKNNNIYIYIEIYLKHIHIFKTI